MTGHSFYVLQRNDFYIIDYIRSPTDYTLTTRQKTRTICIVDCTCLLASLIRKNFSNKKIKRKILRDDL